MGAGKSTVGRLLAERLGRDFIDLDAQIEADAGISIAEIFATRGEAAFRALEREAVEGLIDRGAGVVAMGGGAVVDNAVRTKLLRQAALFTLSASIETLAERVGHGADRPLLAGGDIRARLTEVLRTRAAVYAESHGTIATDGRKPEAIAEEIAERAADLPIVVPLGERTYHVEVGFGIRRRLLERIDAASGGAALVITDEGALRWGREARDALRAACMETLEVVLRSGEEQKNIRTVESIWDAALDAGLDRSAWIVGVGGGVVGDLTAFVASTFLRGVRLAQLPTTLLAMVDSSVGGKTGFNRAQGKNLIGTFYQPRTVLCDIETLSTLPIEERRAGLAEVVKSAWLDSEASVAMLEEDAEALSVGEVEATDRAIRMSVKLKARVVHEDEQEAGRRMILNLGHTVGHGIEAAGAYKSHRHGEAVALGMVAASRIGLSLGVLDEANASRLVRLLDRLQLPTDLGSVLDAPTIGFIRADKKRSQGRVRFVVPGPPGVVEIRSLSVDEIGAMLAPLMQQASTAPRR